MKKLSIFMSLALIISILILTGCASSAPSSQTPNSIPSTTPTPVSSKSTELSLNLMTPATHARYVNVVAPWIKEVEERTNNQVKITPYFSSALSTPDQAYEATVKGICDLAESCQGFDTGHFPLGQIGYLSPTGQSSNRPARAYWELYKSTPEMQSEFANVKVLWVILNSTQHIFMAKKQVRTLDDLQGTKIAVSGFWAGKIVEALGSSPTVLNWGDAYTSLDKGVIDGVVSDYDTLISRQLAQVTKQVTTVNFCACPFFMVMNLQKWNSLPPDIQKTIDEVSGDNVVDLSDSFFSKEEMDCLNQAMEKSNVQNYVLPADEVAKWAAKVEPVNNEFISEMGSKGIQGKSIFSNWLQLWSKYSK